MDHTKIFADNLAMQTACSAKICNALLVLDRLCAPGRSDPEWFWACRVVERLGFTELRVAKVAKLIAN